MQLIAILELRQRDALALARIAGRRLTSAVALRHVDDSRIVFSEIDARHRAESAHRDPPLEGKLVAVEPPAEYQTRVEPRGRRQAVVATQIDQTPTIADEPRRCH